MLLFGLLPAALFLRSSSHGALTHYTRCVGRLRKRCLAWSVSRSSHGCFGYVQLGVRGCASGLSHFNFGKSPKALPSPGSFAPNKSFKPTPHRGVNSVLYATLHAVATPPWGGLTPALGGRKAFGCFSSQCSFSRLRLALLFGLLPAAFLLR